ncbi:MAG: BlaI/MecI/CopY family transcriptional regulator [Verrucomicrobia bacterium]|nr:BlaI/MecI/CopY family transcriptional regulator [Verrucomicrobiota bacterium]
MNTGKGLRLGDLQLRILRILWRHHEATVAEVMAKLGRASRLAYTTVATMLRKMEARGLVRHRVEGRTFIYQPLVGEAQVSRKLTDHLLERLFQGSLSGMVSHLLSTHEVTPDELAKLESLIEERKRAR